MGLSSTSCSSSTGFDKWSLNSTDAKTKHFSAVFFLHRVYTHTRSRISRQGGEQETHEELSGAETRSRWKTSMEGSLLSYWGIQAHKNPNPFLNFRGRVTDGCVKKNKKTRLLTDPRRRDQRSRRREVARRGATFRTCSQHRRVLNCGSVINSARRELLPDVIIYL